MTRLFVAVGLGLGVAACAGAATRGIISSSRSGLEQSIPAVLVGSVIGLAAAAIVKKWENA